VVWPLVPVDPDPGWPRLNSQATESSPQTGRPLLADDLAGRLVPGNTGTDHHVGERREQAENFQAVAATKGDIDASARSSWAICRGSGVCRLSINNTRSPGLASSGRHQCRSGHADDHTERVSPVGHFLFSGANQS